MEQYAGGIDYGLNTGQAFASNTRFHSLHRFGQQTIARRKQ
jgi:hypothetical protein